MSMRKCRARGTTSPAPDFVDLSLSAGGMVPALPHCQEVVLMNLVVWLPAMFLLGLGGMVLCYAFIEACDKI